MTVTVCVPVWNGAAFVAETLASIRAQTETDLRVLVSVDRSDDDSAAVCRAFAGDPRFEVVVQPERLGWVGNVNALLRRVTTPYGCIAPHDDLLEPTFLARLVERLDDHPSAVLAYADMAVLGSSAAPIAQPELAGDRLTRVVTLLHDHLPAVGFRGVFRRAVVDRGHLLRPGFDGFAADTLWLLALAGEGDLLRVAEPLVRKRRHERSETVRWRARPAEAKTVAWIEHCVACHEVAMAAAEWSGAERQAIAAAAMVRLVGLGGPMVRGSKAPTGLADVLLLASHYALRLTGALPPGTPPPTPASLPTELATRLVARPARVAARPDRTMAPHRVAGDGASGGFREDGGRRRSQS